MKAIIIGFEPATACVTVRELNRGLGSFEFNLSTDNGVLSSDRKKVETTQTQIQTRTQTNKQTHKHTHTQTHTHT